MEIKQLCAKCKDGCEGGDIIVEGGNAFKFCKACSDLIKSSPTGNTIHNFLGPKKVESTVAKNMREAKERRDKGYKIWS